MAVSGPASNGNHAGRPDTGTPCANRDCAALPALVTVAGSVATDGDLDIEGAIEGAIRAKKICIAPGARVRGEICGTALVVANGAEIDARVTIGAPRPSAG